MPRTSHVLDASALIVYLRRESGHEHFVGLMKLLEQDGSYFAMHMITVGELYYQFWKTDGESKAEEAWIDISKMPIRIVNSLSESFIKRVGRWTATRGTPYADAFVLATAEEFGVPVVTTDHQHFDPIKDAGLLEIDFLK